MNYTEMLPLLKDLYSEAAVKDMCYKDNPLFALVNKRTDFYGNKFIEPVIYGNPQNRSATFATAKAGTSSSKSVAFELSRVKNYSIATIDNETLEASKNDKGAFLRAAKLEIDGAINSLKRDLAVDMYRSGFGERGQVKTSVGGGGGTTITLKNAYDVTNFEVGMVLEMAASVSGDALRSVTAPIISGIDRNAGTLTITAATVLVANDYIFVKGDREDSATPTARKMSGLSAWVPASAPASTAFFGVDRTKDSRLGGLRLDISSMPIEEGLIDGIDYGSREGASFSHVFMPYKHWSDLKKALGSKVQYVDMQVTPKIGFRGIQIEGAKGSVTVLPDMNCIQDTAFAVQLDTLKMLTLGEPVRIFDADGNMSIRQTDADGIEVRVFSYGNFSAGAAPGWNMNLKLA